MLRDFDCSHEATVRTRNSILSPSSHRRPRRCHSVRFANRQMRGSAACGKEGRVEQLSPLRVTTWQIDMSRASSFVMRRVFACKHTLLPIPYLIMLQFPSRGKDVVTICWAHMWWFPSLSRTRGRVSVDDGRRRHCLSRSVESAIRYWADLGFVRGGIKRRLQLEKPVPTWEAKQPTSWSLLLLSCCCSLTC